MHGRFVELWVRVWHVFRPQRPSKVRLQTQRQKQGRCKPKQPQLKPKGGLAKHTWTDTLIVHAEWIKRGKEHREKAGRQDMSVLIKMCTQGRRMKLKKAHNRQNNTAEPQNNKKKTKISTLFVLKHAYKESKRHTKKSKQQSWPNPMPKHPHDKPH